MGWFTAFKEEVYPGGQMGESLRERNFSLLSARTLAWAAQLSYENYEDGKFDRILQNWRWRKTTVLPGQLGSTHPLVRTRGYIAELNDIKVIAFAGTEPTNLLNWMTDFAINRTRSGITEGFYAGVDAVWRTIVDFVGDPPCCIFLAGHSLGAALAAVTAFRLIEENIITEDRIGGVYTIGMPRVGSAAFAETYNAALGRKTYRLVHGNDIVTRVPPNGKPFYFRHVGRLLSCARGGSFISANLQDPIAETAIGAGLVKEFVGRREANASAAQPPYPGEHAIARALARTLPLAIRDHLPDGYLRALGALRGHSAEWSASL